MALFELESVAYMHLEIQVDNMLVSKQTINGVEVRLETVDDIFTRKMYGTHWVMARDLATDRMKQQIFQDEGKALKYYDYFVDFFTHYRSYDPNKMIGEREKFLRSVVSETVISKAPWYYNQGTKFKGADILPKI